MEHKGQTTRQFNFVGRFPERGSRYPEGTSVEFGDVVKEPKYDPRVYVRFPNGEETWVHPSEVVEVQS